MKPKKERRAYLSLALPQPFDGTMKETKSFVSSLILYIYGKEGRVP